MMTPTVPVVPTDDDYDGNVRLAGAK